jgi:hypothetical protein
MTLQPLPSGFPDTVYEENFAFFFISVLYVLYTVHIIESGRPAQYLNNMSHGQNLRSTSGEPEFVAQ